MIHKFNIEVAPKRNKYKRYYDGLQAILAKTYSDPSKPCNKTVINYCSTVADAYTGYLSTPGYISYSSENDIEEIMNILRYNDYQTQDSDLLHSALIYGVGYELMYFDTTGQTRFRLIEPTTCFGVYDDSLSGDLLYFVRMYKESDWDNTDTYLVDVYGDYETKHYKMSGANGYLTAIGADPNYFSQCPANILALPDEKSIFDCIMGIQDSVNELVSAEIDEYSLFADCYLLITGAELDQEEMAAMKERRGIMLPEGATAQYLTKNANDTQVENILKRLHESAYRVAQCPDFSSESFVGGVSSGIAIRYRLCGMENKAGAIEAIMKKALQRRVEIICGVAALKYGEEVFRDIHIVFKRNIPEDLTAVINTVNSLQGMVSNQTLLAQLPFVDDVNAELEALQEQKQESMSLYGFGAFGSEEESTEGEA